MIGRLILGEASTSHPDGTFSLLRGGITIVYGESAPFAFKGALVVCLESDIGDQGSHRFDVTCMDEDGGEALPKLEGGFDVGKKGAVSTFNLGINTKLKKKGRYVFVLRVDNVQRDTWTLTTTDELPQGLDGGK